MATGLDSLGVRPPTAVEAARPVAAIGDTRQELYQRALQQLVGQSLQSQVLSRYTDGSFLVKFADTAARVILPPGTQVGSSVQLTLVSVQPRPTFFLGNEADGKLAKSPLIYLDPHGSEEVELSEESELPPQLLTQKQSQEQSANRGLARQFLQIDSLLRQSDRIAIERAANQAGDAGQLDSHDPHAPARSAQASLSNAGQLISNLLSSAQQKGAPQALQGQNAILPAPQTNSHEVASALHDTLAYSGLFYESHVSEWADGKRPISELLREPQMQAATNQPKNTQDNNQLTFPQLVNLQLNVHEQQSTHWRGEIWPGQNMEWDVEKQPQHSNGGADATPAWQSTVRFNFPGLGNISARLYLQGEHLQIQIKTDNADTAQALREQAPVLSEALHAAGSSLDSLLVQSDETPSVI
jgi:Flagellar hook-length control protein FliK